MGCPCLISLGKVDEPLILICLWTNHHDPKCFAIPEFSPKALLSNQRGVWAQGLHLGWWGLCVHDAPKTQHQVLDLFSFLRDRLIGWASVGGCFLPSGANISVGSGVWDGQGNRDRNGCLGSGRVPGLYSDGLHPSLAQDVVINSENSSSAVREPQPGIQHRLR